MAHHVQRSRTLQRTGFVILLVTLSASPASWETDTYGYDSTSGRANQAYYACDVDAGNTSDLINNGASVFVIEQFGHPWAYLPFLKLGGSGSYFAYKLPAFPLSLPPEAIRYVRIEETGANDRTTVNTDACFVTSQRHELGTLPLSSHLSTNPDSCAVVTAEHDIGTNDLSSLVEDSTIYIGHATTATDPGFVYIRNMRLKIGIRNPANPIVSNDVFSMTDWSHEVRWPVAEGAVSYKVFRKNCAVGDNVTIGGGPCLWEHVGEYDNSFAENDTVVVIDSTIPLPESAFHYGVVALSDVGIPSDTVPGIMFKSLPKVFMLPSLTNPSPGVGSQFNCIISLKNTYGAKSAAVTLSYDPTRLQAVEVVEDEALNFGGPCPDAALTLTKDVDNTAGYAHVGVSRPENSQGCTLWNTSNNTRPFVVVTFKAKQPDTAWIEFLKPTVRDEEQDSFTVSFVNSGDTLNPIPVDIQPAGSAVITGITPDTMYSDQPHDISFDKLTVYDPAGNYPDGFSILLEAGEEYTVDGSTITVNDPGFNGELAVPVSVTTGTDTTNVDTLRVHVIARTKPRIERVDSVTIPEDSLYTVTFDDLEVTDPAGNYPDGFTIVPRAGDDYTVDGVSLTPAADFFGELQVPLLVVSAAEDTSNTQTMAVTVTPVNDKPVIHSQLEAVLLVLDTVSSSTPVVAVRKDVLELSDADNSVDELSLYVREGDHYTVGTRLQNENFIKPDSGFTGTLAVPSVVTDGADTSDIFTIEVRIISEGEPPDWVALLPRDTVLVVPLHGMVAFSAHASDGATDFPVTYLLDGEPTDSNLVFDSLGTFIVQALSPVGDDDTLKHSWKVSTRRYSLDDTVACTIRTDGKAVLEFKGNIVISLAFDGEDAVGDSVMVKCQSELTSEDYPGVQGLFFEVTGAIDDPSCKLAASNSRIPANYAIQYFNPEADAWEELADGDYDEESHTVSARMQNYGRFVVTRKPAVAARLSSVRTPKSFAFTAEAGRIQLAVPSISRGSFFGTVVFHDVSGRVCGRMQLADMKPGYYTIAPPSKMSNGYYIASIQSPEFDAQTLFLKVGPQGAR